MPKTPRPLIGITGNTRIGGAWGECSKGSRLDFLDESYPAGVEAAGGLPLIIPIYTAQENIARVLERIDGLILSGGPDILPRFYEQEPRPGLGEVNYELDLMELSLAREALDTDLPILGICRGIQVLAAVGGGTLFQDLETELPGCLKHRVAVDKATLSHQVEVIRPSRLHEIVDEDRIWVNSGHHQAVKDLPPGWQASAKAADGVIEAMELPGERFCLGVQWHPEGTARHDPASQAIFQALVQAAGL
jgi:putative glutamine amidotransferase